MKEDDQRPVAEIGATEHTSRALVRTGSRALARRGLQELAALPQPVDSGDKGRFLFCLEHSCAHAECPNVPHLDFGLVPIKVGSKLPGSVPEQIDMVTEEWTYEDLTSHYALPWTDSHPVSQAWTKIGIRFASVGRHAEALTCYEKALQLDERNFAAWVNKG